jgi:acetyl esterase/lipase
MRTAVAVLLVLSAAASAQEEKKAERPVPKQKRPVFRLPEGVTAHRDLEYGPHGERNMLDLFVPKADGPVPLIIWVHGGGWQNGSKNGGNPAMPLLEKGYAVAAINYRLSAAAKFPAQIEDCKAAVRFLRAGAAKYGLNADRFGAWGSSAGGHLVALLGTSGDVKELEGDGRNGGVSSRVQAVCDWFGPTDLLQMNQMAGPGGRLDHDSPNSPESKLIGGPFQENKEKAGRASPIKYVTADDPPFLFLHGDKDPLVPWQQSRILHDALKAAGVDSKLIVVAGAGHGQGIGTPENLAEITAFFDRILKAPKSSGP